MTEDVHEKIIKILKFVMIECSKITAAFMIISIICMIALMILEPYASM